MADKATKEKTDDGTRTFLCVVDESEELAQALRFACRRAVHSNGRVALLYVVGPAEFQHWAAVGDLMREERREEAEEMLQVVASVVQKQTSHTPVIGVIGTPATVEYRGRGTMVSPWPPITRA